MSYTHCRQALEGFRRDFICVFLTTAVEYSKTVIIATHMVIGWWKLYFVEDGRLYVSEETKAVERGYLQ